MIVLVSEGLGTNTKGAIFNWAGAYVGGYNSAVSRCMRKETTPIMGDIWEDIYEGIYMYGGVNMFVSVGSVAQGSCSQVHSLSVCPRVGGVRLHSSNTGSLRHLSSGSGKLANAKSLCTCLQPLSNYAAPRC